ncbi:MAG: osmotically inducible protein OsmC [Bacteroidetes bacterium HGW-Bacteroidetes-6]|jgi:putative redox protein|nr:MAG: osmotically inducible protein OsmC [Bacteroidetes bacterium HGW-Bacteroidetes-6]
MIDKSKTLQTTISLINSKVKFDGWTEGNKPVSIDYIPPVGDSDGYTSLELLLLSLSSCLGTALLLFLRRMNKTIGEFRIEASGDRRQEHPTCFSKITLEIHLQASDTTVAEVEKVIKMAEETYCPVWALLKGNVEIETNVVIAT